MGKKRPERRQPTAEERSRAADAKLKRYITKSALEWADREPEVRRQMVAQTFGYKLPDQAEKSRQELIAYIDELAIKRLKEDDGLARAVVEARIRQVTGEMGLQIEGEEWRRKPLSIDDYIERAKKFKELKEVLGVKEPGFWNSLMDPKVIANLLAIIREVFIEKQPPAEDKALVMVQVNGINRLITMEEFVKMEGKEPIKYIGSVEPSEPDNEEKSNDPTSEPETPNKTEEGDGETGTAGPGK